MELENGTIIFGVKELRIIKRNSRVSVAVNYVNKLGDSSPLPKIHN